MNILVINPILYTSTTKPVHKVSSIADTMIHGMCNALCKLGHQVTLAAVDDYCPTKEETYPYEIRWFHNSCDWLPSPLPLPISFYAYLKKSSDQFDLIITSEVFSFMSLLAAMIAPKKTLVWQELSVHQRKWCKIPSKLWHHCVVPWAFGRVCCIVPRSERARTFISRYCRRVTAEVVDHGTDIGQYASNEPKRAQFICIGRLVESKGIDTIIRRFADFVAIPDMSHYTLLIAGQGPLLEQLQSLTTQLGLDKRVQFLGQQPHNRLGLALSQSVASLVATTHDLNMVSITESIACGTPVITNRVPNTADAIERHRLGIVRDDWDARDMITIVSDPGFARRCQARREKSTCQAAAHRLIQLFEQNVTPQLQ